MTTVRTKTKRMLLLQAATLPILGGSILLLGARRSADGGSGHKWELAALGALTLALALQGVLVGALLEDMRLMHVVDEIDDLLAEARSIEEQARTAALLAEAEAIIVRATGDRRQATDGDEWLERDED